jgi:hypothetical protein
MEQCILLGSKLLKEMRVHNTIFGKGRLAVNVLFSSSLLCVEGVYFFGDVRGLHASLAVVLSGGIGLIGHQVHSMLLVLLGHSVALGTSKEVHVLLLGEVDVIVPVGVRELCWVPSVILIPRVRAQGVTIGPRLQLEVGNGASTVEIGDLHGSSVSLVVDRLSASKPLLLLLEGLENVIGANLHNRELLVHAGLTWVGSRAGFEVADLAVAAAGDHALHQGHVL